MTPASDSAIPVAAQRSDPRLKWRAGRGSPLKLLSALRGDGALVWSGGEVAATYELHVFGQGSARTGSGRAEGHCGALLERTADQVEGASSCRLRLHDGREIEIDLVCVDPTAIEFDACGNATSLLA
jgi:hypothetical protein